jgi:hypothetical protein
MLPSLSWSPLRGCRLQKYYYVAHSERQEHSLREESRCLGDVEPRWSPWPNFQISGVVKGKQSAKNKKNILYSSILTTKWGLHLIRARIDSCDLNLDHLTALRDAEVTSQKFAIAAWLECRVLLV